MLTVNDVLKIMVTKVNSVISSVIFEQKDLKQEVMNLKKDLIIVKKKIVQFENSFLKNNKK